jgi:hypothetical protein
MQSAGYGWIIEQNLIKIEEGDTLWDVSRQLLGDGSRYEEIWQNRLYPEKYRNPNLIFPGMQFRNIGEKISDDSIVPTDKKNPVGYLKNLKSDLKAIVDNGSVAMENLNLIQKEVITINNSLAEIKESIKNDPDQLKGVENKNAHAPSNLARIAKKILNKMDRIIDEIKGIHSPGFWSTILDKLLIAACAGAGGTLIIAAGKYGYDFYKRKRWLAGLGR